MSFVIAHIVVHKEVQACISFKYLFLAFRRFLSIMLPFVKLGELKKDSKKRSRKHIDLISDIRRIWGV